MPSKFVFILLCLKKELKVPGNQKGFSLSISNQDIKKFTNSPLSNDDKIKPDNSVVLPFDPLYFKFAEILK